MGVNAFRAAVCMFAALPGASFGQTADECPPLSAGARRFADYPAAPTKRRPAHLQLVAPKARQYRTVLRKGAAEGPNFAGHYTIVHIGCGAGVTCFAIVDAWSGAVHFPGNVTAVARAPGNSPANLEDCPILAYRLDSKVLFTYGAVDEDDARDGVSWFEWTGRRFRLRHFTARADLVAGRREVMH